jgi:hypothetical protein
MPKTTCNQRLHDGAQSRRNTPLYQGSYKILEVITDFSDIRAELDRVKDVRTKKVSPNMLRHCTAQDAHVWTRTIPLYVAHSLGRNVLAGLLASVNEGAIPKIACEAYVDLIHRCEALTHRLDAALHEAGGNTLQTCDLLKPLIQDAINISRQALAVASPHRSRAEITTGES